MSLQEELKAFNQGFVDKVPAEVVTTMTEATELLHRSGLAEAAVEAGQRAPDFDLPELGGGRVTLSTILKDGPV
ncbi:MAG TPA: AhpC/TSA family protein, partial [Mariprofundaceae bacterium]|nr:AhpC/TSA family protein [Mariprofundaceae bacterium]